MMEQREWARARDALVKTVAGLGFPEELGNEMAKNLGSPKAMHRMQVYLENVKPKKVELVVDEMLSICSEINAWREKKASEEANANFNEIMYYGLTDDEEG
ncbi:MAG: hypothetical protein K6D90_02125 [Lachnospiraceae bacterium]|nr:hypothetical protein [Lachnospiraceae bacterium]